MAAAVVAVHLAEVLLIDRASLWGYAGLRRDLGARLAERGLAPPDDAVFVGLAPSGEPRVYDTHFDWDVGFLTLGPDRLVYLGDRTRFALPRRDVTGAALGPNLSGWLRMSRLYVSWDAEAEEPEAATELVSAVSFSAVGKSLRGTARATRELEARFRAWREGESMGETATTGSEIDTSRLGRPHLEPVASRAQTELVSVRGVVAGAIFYFALTCLVALVGGLSFGYGPEAPPGDAWRAAAVAALAGLPSHLPLVRDRRAVASWSFGDG